MVVVDAALERVTVYASGAHVRRVARLAAAAPALRIAGLPLTVIDDTVRIEIEGPAIATIVRPGIAAPAADRAAAEEPAELRAARRRVALADGELARLAAALDRGARAPVVANDLSDQPPPAWAAVVAARRALAALRGERELALRQAAAAAQRERDEAGRALAAAIDRDQRAGSARPPRLHELRKHVDLELIASGPGAIAIHLEYLVGPARWAPSYVARLDGERGELEVRAVVAQDTGEDWTGVPLRLSTAEPARFAQLPELAAQRIGRRQPEPARAGFRAPPAGAGALFADYDRELAPVRAALAAARRRPEPGRVRADDGAGAPPAALEALDQEVWDDQPSDAKQAFKTPLDGRPLPQAGYRRAPTPLPAPAPAPAPAAAKSRARTLVSRLAPAQALGGLLADDDADDDARAVEGSEGGGGSLARPAPVAAVRLDYGGLVMAPPASPQRGMLVPAPPDRSAGGVAGELAVAHARIAALPLPPGCAAEWAHSHDYAFASDGAVDVRGDGAWHAIAVTAKPAAARLRHVSVPREQADVFRVAAIANPFAGPLLPGPIDVYDRGRFLVTSSVDHTPPGGVVDIGLGVDPAVKIARNTEFHEAAAGMLRGKLGLHHAIAIDVENLTGRAIELEVRERVPVALDGDGDVAIAVGDVDPAWQEWTPDPEAPRDERLRGGRRWRIELAAGARRTLRAAYAVTIAGKLELIGGNRRER